jgi:hypothetical protein
VSIAVPSMMALPSRTQEFENFKNAKGAEVNAMLNDNKGIF